MSPARWDFHTVIQYWCVLEVSQGPMEKVPEVPTSLTRAASLLSVVHIVKSYLKLCENLV